MHGALCLGMDLESVKNLNVKMSEQTKMSALVVGRLL